jgi:hypothetical protein
MAKKNHLRHKSSTVWSNLLILWWQLRSFEVGEEFGVPLEDEDAEIRYHFICEKVKSKEIELVSCPHRINWLIYSPSHCPRTNL